MPLLLPGQPFPPLTVNLPGGRSLLLPDALTGGFAMRPGEVSRSLRYVRQRRTVMPGRWVAV
jgi:hypothetical protein